MAKKLTDHTKRIPASPELVERVRAIQGQVQQAHAEIEHAGQSRINDLVGLSKAEAKLADEFVFHLQDYAWVTRNGKAKDA